MMNRKVMIGTAVGFGVAALAASAAKRCVEDAEDTTAPATMWDKMKERMDEMPEDFPPRVMFDNVATIRENTDRMLEVMLERAGHDDLVTAL